jgi:hypothetical protein
MNNLENDTIVLLNDGRLYENQLEKIFALQALKSNPGILGNVFTFEKLVYVLNGFKPNIDILEPSTILHIAKAVKLLGEQNWHREVKKYIAEIAFEEGWCQLPDILKFAQDELDEISNEVKLDIDQQKMQDLKHKAVERYLND